MRLHARFSFALLALLLLGLVAGAMAQSKTRKKPRPATRQAAAPAQPVAPVIPNNTEIKIRLTSDIDTKTAKDGDKFTATVIEPSQYANATLEGHIAAVQQSGKLKGKTALSLTFCKVSYGSG